jgi:hypothetical protein
MVVKNSQQFLQTALTNNTFDVDITDKSLRMALDHSFSYLYRLQRNMACYEEYFYTTRNKIKERDFGDFYMDKRERICVNYPIELIPTQSREKFRLSKYYGTKISYDTIISDHTLFSRLPIIMFDGQVLRDFEIEIFDDFITVHTNFDRYFLHTKKFDSENWEYEFISHTESVQVVNNANYTDINTNTGMLQVNSYSNTGYDRIKMSYLQNFNFVKKTDGLYFAAVFKDGEKLGTGLQEVTFDDNGDVYIHYDSDAKTMLNNYTGKVMIRLYFYRYLKKYDSFADDGYAWGKMIKTKVVDGENTSELFTINDYENDNKPYALPVPTENFLIFRAQPTNYDFYTPPAGAHYPNSNLKVYYPNLYQFDNCEPNSYYRIYYFYIPPYDLSYKELYPFLKHFLRYTFPHLDYERVVNTVILGDITYAMSSKTTATQTEIDTLIRLAAAYHTKKLVDTKTVPDDLSGVLYNELIETNGYNFEYCKSQFINNLTDDYESSELIIPEEYDRFAYVFDMIVNHGIVDYFYDEMDYIRKYADKMHPLEYKITKLKEFIKDDWQILQDYVKQQNKVAIKYEYAAKDIDLNARYCTQRADGKKFGAGFYAFPIKRAEPDSPVAARIFVDGLNCSVFDRLSYEYSDIFYIPEEYITEDSYIEIEVYHVYEAKTTCVFDISNPSIELSFPAKEFIKPTLSDIYYYIGDDDTNDRIDKDAFRVEFISDRYNYYVDGNQVSIFYSARSGSRTANKGPYYDIDGHYYTFEGQPDPTKDIDTGKLNDMISDHQLIEDIGYLTDNHLTILKLDEPKTYAEVLQGVSTLLDGDDEDKGVLHSDITKVRITLLDTTLYGENITIAISKSPEFSGWTMTTVDYPTVEISTPNNQEINEYSRVFINGRQVSKNKYEISDYIGGVLDLQLLQQLEKGETLGFDVTPFRNQLIMYVDKLESYYLDLRGYIDKPFDLKNYEVYLNGRRLNKTNIFPISPWEVRLAGLHSVYNLEIYEKDRDWEYYGIDFSNYYTFSDFIREPFIPADIRQNMIDDITGPVLPNDTCEDPLSWDKTADIYSIFFEIFYYRKLIPSRFITADREDFSIEEIKNKYPIIYDYFVQTTSSGTNVLLLNPDNAYYSKQISGDEESSDEDLTEEELESKNTWNVYLLGNTSLELDDYTIPDDVIVNIQGKET